MVLLDGSAYCECVYCGNGGGAGLRWRVISWNSQLLFIIVGCAMGCL